MNFFTHLLLGVLIALPFMIQFQAHRKLFLFTGALFGILPDIDYILGGFTMNHMYAGLYIGDYKEFISPEIQAKIIDVLNAGLVERTLAQELNLEHRGITHAWSLIFWFAVGMGLIYLWFKKRSSTHAKPWLLLSLIATLAWISHIFVDFGFTEYSPTGHWRKTTYGLFCTLDQYAIDFIDTLSFLILFILLIGWLYHNKIKKKIAEVMPPIGYIL